MDYALAEIKNKRLDSEIKFKFERIKLAQLQKQLELANIQKNLIENSDIQNPSVFETAANINVETLLKSVKTLTIPVPSRVESYNLFFQSLEKAFKIKEVPEQFKCEILLNILALVDVDQKIVSARNRKNKLLHYPRERNGNSFFPLDTMTEVNQEPRFALSVNAESFVPKEDETQIVATACFKNKCLLSTALIL
ncbi:uncharacterized protein TNCV_1647351 [Trichonephila clavipes]|nr:uncharacterized protein TNCV_1647351 [Trichonephila clavipes]